MKWQSKSSGPIYDAWILYKDGKRYTVNRSHGHELGGNIVGFIPFPRFPKPGDVRPWKSEHYGDELPDKSCWCLVLTGTEKYIWQAREAYWDAKNQKWRTGMDGKVMMWVPYPTAPGGEDAGK